MSAPGRVRRWAALGAEACGSLLLVLALFWLFILFLYALFPSGTPLKELVRSRLEPASPRRPAAGREPEATLSSLFRDVRFRRGNSIAWGGASQGMQLYSQDAVQTFDRAGATLSFGGSDRLQVGSNSLVVVTRLDQGVEAGPRSYRVQVDGELRGSLCAGSRLRMEFAAAGHLACILPGAARFALTRKDADSASLAVYAGEARVLSRGRVVRVPANFGITVTRGMPVGPPLPLPAPPLLAPKEALYSYRLLPPRVGLAWSGPAGEYHLQLGTDAAFRDCLVDERLAQPGYLAGKLGEGRYFWRVSRVEQGREGAFSRVGRFRLLQVLTPPRLSVGFPPARVQAGPYTLSGRSEPGSRIFVDGVEVAHPGSGAFAHQVLLKPGVNLIRVEALDSAGNASYASSMVYARPESRGAEQGAP